MYKKLFLSYFSHHEWWSKKSGRKSTHLTSVFSLRTSITSPQGTTLTAFADVKCKCLRMLDGLASTHPSKNAFYKNKDTWQLQQVTSSALTDSRWRDRAGTCPGFRSAATGTRPAATFEPATAFPAAGWTVATSTDGAESAEEDLDRRRPWDSGWPPPPRIKITTVSYWCLMLPQRKLVCLSLAIFSR